MKKKYISPSATIFSINAVTLMAASERMTISDTTTVNTSAGEQLGRESNPGSNLWDQEW